MRMTMHKARSIDKWFAQFGVEQLDWSAQNHDLNIIQHITNALVAECAQIPAARLQHLLEILETLLRNP